MYVCICKAVRESDLHAACAAGVRDMAVLRSRFDIASGCGKCGREARALLDSYRQQPVGAATEASA